MGKIKTQTILSHSQILYILKLKLYILLIINHLLAKKHFF